MDFIAIILDVGNHMYDDISSIDKAINSVKGLIQKKLFAENKDELAIILCGSHETKNNLNNDDKENYKHIMVSKSLSRVNWDLLEDLKVNNPLYGSFKGDLMEAILVAADHLVNEVKFRKAKGLKRVILISNLEGETDYSQIIDMALGLSKEDIELNIISDREFGGNDDAKGGAERGDGPSTSDRGRDKEQLEKISETKLDNEKHLSKVVAELNGTTYSFDDVLLSLDFFETKSTKPRGWKVDLEISNICNISIAGYPKVKAAAPQTLKLRYGGDPSAEIEKRTTYHLSDDNSDTVSLEDTIKAFRYGNSLVPFSDEDIESMKLSVVKSLKLIGFCEEENVSRNLFVGDSSMVFVAEDSNSQVAFTALVQAMYECNMVALVRKVYSSASAPRLAALSPLIKSKYVCLVYSELAFGEDFRSYKFQPLPGPSTNAGANKTKKTISGAQLQAVDKFIDHMMLVKKGATEEESTELLKPTKTVSPFIQMFYHCASHKFLNPTSVLPKLNDRVMTTLEPPRENQEGLDALIEEIRALFPLKIRESTAKRKNPMAGEESQENGSAKKSRPEDEDKLPKKFGDMASSSVTEVGSVRPVEDFNKLLERGDIHSAIESMQTIIWQLINDSYLDTLYPKAILCLVELRKKSIEYSQPPDRNLIVRFNEFLHNIKKTILLSQSKIGFWNLLKKENVNLIGESESEMGCQDEDYRLFFDIKEESIDVPEVKEEDFDTLFDDM